MAPSDARAVRALSHPLRLELLDLLRFEGASTATLLARRVGESSGATSYHLRQLARHGFVEEVPGAGRGRERWWRHRERRLDVAPPSPSAVTQRAEAARLVAEILTREAHALHGYLTRPERLPGWDQAAFLEARGLPAHAGRARHALRPHRRAARRAAPRRRRRRTRGGAAGARARLRLPVPAT